MIELSIDTAVEGLSNESAEMAAMAERFGFDGISLPS